MCGLEWPPAGSAVIVLTLTSGVIVLCRCLVAVAFLMSAGWKLRNKAGFNVVMSGSSSVLLRKASIATALRPALSLAEAVAAIFLIVAASQIYVYMATAIALGVLLATSAFLLRADSLANGCGCWRPVRRGRARAAPYLVRNALLIILVIAAALPAQRPGAGLVLVLVVGSLLPAMLIMEIPTVLEITIPVRVQQNSSR